MASTGSLGDDTDRCRCGRTIEAGHRFCPDCGAALVDGAVAESAPPSSPTPSWASPSPSSPLVASPPAVAPDPPVDLPTGPVLSAPVGSAVGPDGRPQLLDPFAPAGSTDEVVRVERSGLGSRLGVLAAVVVVGLGAWALFRPSSADVSPDDEEAAEVGGEDADPDELDGTDPEGADEAPDALDDDNDAHDDEHEDEHEDEGGSTATDGPTTSVPGGAATGGGDGGGGDDGDEGEAPIAGPLLGEETGLSLVGGTWGGLFHLVDLDTGERRELDRVSGEPLAVAGTTLVFRSTSGVPRMLDLADPEAAIVSPRLRPGGWADVVAVDDDLVWMIEDSPDGVIYRAYDVAGEPVDELDLAAIGLGTYGPFVPSIDLIQHPGGGLYRREGDDFRRVSEGRALAIGDGLAVVERCDERLRCRSEWFDITTEDAVDLPPPPDDLGGQVFSRIVGSDRWLVSFDWGVGSARLIEIATGQEREGVEFSPSPGPFGPGLGLGISGDGRWMVDTSGREAVVIDLDRGTEWPIGLERVEVGLLIATPR